LRFLDKTIKFSFEIYQIYYNNSRKRVRRGQLRCVISRQPFGVEGQMSPFWKVDDQGYNVSETKKILPELKPKGHLAKK
jgi:hypothetical protein